jgi:hypothetical protein
MAGTISQLSDKAYCRERITTFLRDLQEEHGTLESLGELEASVWGSFVDGIVEGMSLRLARARFRTGHGLDSLTTSVRDALTLRARPDGGFFPPSADAVSVIDTAVADDRPDTGPPVELPPALSAAFESLGGDPPKGVHVMTQASLADIDANGRADLDAAFDASVATLTALWGPAWEVDDGGKGSDMRVVCWHRDEAAWSVGLIEDEGILNLALIAEPPTAPAEYIAAGLTEMAQQFGIDLGTEEPQVTSEAAEPPGDVAWCQRRIGEFLASMREKYGELPAVKSWQADEYNASLDSMIGEITARLGGARFNDGHSVDQLSSKLKNALRLLLSPMGTYGAPDEAIADYLDIAVADGASG